MIYRNKQQANSSAIKTHYCMDCGHRQRKKYNLCPQCGSKNRQLFDSDKEFKRGMRLLQMEKVGLITDLKFQVPFQLHVNGTKVATYKADSYYIKGGEEVYEDVKGSKASITA